MPEFAFLAGLLQVPVPAWIILLVIAAGYILNLAQQSAIHRRLDAHARTLGYTSRWAGLVDERLDELALLPQRQTFSEVRPTTLALRDSRGHTPAAHDLSREQVKKLVSRLSPSRAA